MSDQDDDLYLMARLFQWAIAGTLAFGPVVAWLLGLE